MIWLRRFIIFYPIGYILVTGVAWLAARLTLGHMPRPSLDDPKEIGGVFPLINGLMGFFFFALFLYVGILSLLLTMAVIDAPNRWGLLRDCAISFVLIAAFFLLMRLAN